MLRSWSAPVALALLASCSPRTPPDVLLIVLDTVRADHLSCHGYARPTTPNLDALAARSDRYTEVRATAPWTLPSHASLFTGKFPHEHGADAHKTADGRFVDALPLAADEWTLAEALAQHGYRTGAFVANVAHVNRRNGLNQGFRTFECEKLDARGTNAKALAWLDEDGAESARPTFLFLNYMDAHREYNVAPLAPERARMLPTPPQQDVGDMLDALSAAILEAEAQPPPQLLQRVVDAYDLGLANLDAALGELLAELERRGRLANTVVVVTSDHGEYFGEHDLIEHSKDVYEPGLRIPLIVKRPGVDLGRVLEMPLSIADVPRLVLALFPRDLATLAARFPGSSRERGLLAELRFTRAKDLGASYGKRFDRERQVLYEGGWKLIRSSDGAHELYDLAVDPAEARNLFAERPDEAQRLLARLLTLTANRRQHAGDPPTEPMSEDELRTLRELGY